MAFFLSCLFLFIEITNVSPVFLSFRNTIASLHICKNRKNVSNKYFYECIFNQMLIFFLQRIFIVLNIIEISLQYCIDRTQS